MQITAFILFTIFLSSCGIYNSHFDCPPGEGVGCASVGEVMDMIIEKEEGEDLFVKNRGDALLLQTKHRSKEERLMVVQSDSGELMLISEKREEKR